MKPVTKLFCPSTDTMFIMYNNGCAGTMEDFVGLAAIALQDFPGLVMGQIRPHSHMDEENSERKIYGVEFSAKEAFTLSGRDKTGYTTVASFEENDLAA